MGREKLILNVVATMETHSFCFVLNLFIWVPIEWNRISSGDGIHQPRITQACSQRLAAFISRSISSSLRSRSNFSLVTRQASFCVPQKARFDSPGILFYPVFPVCIPVATGTAHPKGLSEMGVPGTTPQHVGVCLWTNQEIKKLGHGKS